MQKKEREWVAILLTEVRFVGMPDVTRHYLDVLARLDPDLLEEYRKCVRIFNLEENHEREKA